MADGVDDQGRFSVELANDDYSVIIATLNATQDSNIKDLDIDLIGFYSEHPENSADKVLFFDKINSNSNIDEIESFLSENGITRNESASDKISNDEDSSPTEILLGLDKKTFVSYKNSNENTYFIKTSDDTYYWLSLNVINGKNVTVSYYVLNEACVKEIFGY